MSDERSTDDERVRDHLANERTYLAWLRTGVATMGLGVVIAKLKYILGNSYSESSGIVQVSNIGIVFTLVGITTIVFSVVFFLQTRQQIRFRTYVSKTVFALGLAMVMGGLGLVILWYLFQPSALH